MHLYLHSSFISQVIDYKAMFMYGAHEDVIISSSLPTVGALEHSFGLTFIVAVWLASLQSVINITDKLRCEK